MDIYENIYNKILAYSDNQRRFMSAEDLDNYLKHVLADCYDHLKKFYFNAFKRCVSKNNTYIVFVARRCAVLGDLFLRTFKHEFSEEGYDYLQKSIYTDAGFRALVINIAKECYRNSDYECTINLYDDILIHGRAIGGLLSSAEEIFINQYQKLCKQEPNEEIKCSSTISEHQLVTRFLNMVHIRTAAQSKYTLLLNPRYVSRIQYDDENKCDMTVANEWRRRSYRCADAIFNSDIPNACFVPHIKMKLQGRKIIKQTFSDSENQSKFQVVTTEYKNRKLDTYTWLLPVTTRTKAIFTVRCTDDYLIPFAFLPACSSDKMKLIENAIICKLQSSFASTYFERLSEFSNLLQVWSEYEAISVLYTEVIDLVFSLTVLKLFLNDLNNEERINEFNFDLIRNNTNIRTIMANYAHEKLIEDLIVVLLDPKLPPIFTYEEIENLICGSTTEDQYIVDDISIITKEMNCLEKEAINVLEEAAFQCGSKSELEAFSLSNCSFIPCRRSILMLRFPVKNSIEAFLNSVYLLNDSWCCDHVPLKSAISYILQFMDAGVLAVSTGRDKDRYILSVRPGEQSLVTVPMRYALFIPLMKEIEDRCLRQGRTPRSSFYAEFEYFMMILSEYKLFNSDNCESLNNDISFYNNLKECESDLNALADYLYSSGQSFSDYMFTLNEYYKEKDKENFNDLSEKHIRWCKSLYYNVIYQ